MKVCDAHPDRRAVETLSSAVEGMQIDICEECKAAVFALFAKAPPPELAKPPIAPPPSDAPSKAPKRGLSFLGITKP